MVEIIFMGEPGVAESDQQIKKKTGDICKLQKSRHCELMYIISDKHENPRQGWVGKLPMPVSLLLAKYIHTAQRENSRQYSRALT